MTKRSGLGGRIFLAKIPGQKGAGLGGGIFLAKILGQKGGGPEGNFPCQNSWTKREEAGGEFSVPFFFLKKNNKKNAPKRLPRGD